MSLDVEVRFNQYEVLQIFYKPKRQQSEYILEFEVAVRGGGFVIEVYENKLFLASRLERYTLV